MFNSVDINSFSNVFKEIGEKWMLVTARHGGKLNTMTASWGGAGFLWGMPVAFLFIRPQRYTHELLQETTSFTASFYPESMRSALNLCGSRSGRDFDKIADSGLTPVYDERGFTYFEQAESVLCMKKLYVQQLDLKCAVDTEIFVKNYPNRDYHHMYVAKIEDYLKKGD